MRPSASVRRTCAAAWRPSSGLLFCLLYGLWLGGIPLAPSHAAPPPKLNPAELESRLLTGEYTFRVMPNLCPKVYVTIEGREYYYVHKESRFFPQKSPIKGVKFTRFAHGADGSTGGPSMGKTSISEGGYSATTKNYLRAEFQHPHLARGDIQIYRSTGAVIDNADDVMQILGYAFEGPALPAQKLFVGDRKSKRLFFVGVNHLPPVADRVEFSTEAEAEAQGYVRSTLSFARIPQIPSYETEFMLGLQASSAQRMYGNLDTDDQRRKQVEAIGKRVLDHWPTTLKGYQYKFYVLDTRSPNACACPAGTIYVHNALIDILENDDELEAIMAHEIAHVEKRHGLRMHRSAETGAMVGAVLLLGAGAAASRSNHDIAAAAVGISGMVVQVGSAIALTGHSRQLETEADHFAALYLLRNGKDPAILARALKKLRYYRDLLGQSDQQASVFSSHPDLGNRIAMAESTTMKAYEKPAVFDGFSKNGELVATISFEAEAMHTPPNSSRTLTLLAELATTTALEKPDKVSTIVLLNGKKSVTLTNLEKTPVSPLDTVTLSFQTTWTEPGSPPVPDQIKFTLGPVQKWEKRAE